MSTGHELEQALTHFKSTFMQVDSDDLTCARILTSKHGSKAYSADAPHGTAAAIFHCCRLHRCAVAC